MKKLSLILSMLIIASVVHVSTVDAQMSGTINQLNPWKTSGGYILPVNSANGLKVPSLGSSGDPCIKVDANGAMSTTTCGSGSGSGGVGTSTNPFMATYFVATSTAATSTFAGNVVVGDTVRQRNSNLEIGGSALFQDFYGSAIPADWYNKQKSFLSVTGTSIAGTYCEPEDVCLGSTVYTYGVLSSPMGSKTGGSSHIGGVYSFYGEPRGDSTNKYGVYLTGENKNYFSGNVGIGTTSPFAKLSVVGEVVAEKFTATSTTATSTFTNLAVTNGFVLAPVVLIKPDGTQIPYGQGAASDAVRGAALESAVSASAAGDKVLVHGSTFTVSNSLVMPASTSLVGVGKPIIQSTFTGTPTITVQNSTTTIEGVKIVTADTGIGYIGASTMNFTGLEIARVEIAPNSTSACAIAWGISCTSAAGNEHYIQGTIRDSVLNGGSLSNFGVRVVLASGSSLKLINNEVFGATDSILIGGSSAATVEVFGGSYTSTLDPITSGGATIYVNGAKARGLSGGTNADLWEDGGNIIAVGADYTTASDYVEGDFNVPVNLNVGSKITTANASTTNATISGKLFDSLGSAGMNGMVLQTTGSASKWVATSSLGIIGSQWTTSGSNIYYNTGNVGIGTTSPFTKLSVAGNAYIGGNLTATGTLTLKGGTTTAANGFDITDGCFAVDGVCIGSGASLSGGSPNTLTYWTSGSTVGATSSPTVGYITATSTTATSTFGLARIGQPYDISSRLIVNDVLSYITVEAPTGGSATQTESGNYMACGLIYFYDVYAYKIIGGVTVYSSPLQIVFEDYDYTEDCSSTFFDVNLSWTASPGADGYKVVVTADDYIGIYGDAYRATTNTSTVMDGDYTSEYPMVVTPSSPYIILANPYGLAVIGNTIINGNSNFNGNIYATGTQIISAPNEASGLIIKGKGSGGSPAYHPLKIQNSTGQDNFFFGNSEFNGYGDYAAAGFVGRGSESPYMGDFVWTDANNALPNTDARVAFMSVQGSKSGSTANYRTIFGMRNTANNTSIETLTFNSAGNVGMGGATAPTSTLTIKGNATVGASYITTAAPANGLLVQGNVGIGTTSPAVKLDVHGGGIRINPGTSSMPTCDASLRGTMWYVKGGSGEWDMMYVCMKEDIDVYSWMTIAP